MAQQYIRDIPATLLWFNLPRLFQTFRRGFCDNRISGMITHANIEPMTMMEAIIWQHW